MRKDAERNDTISSEQLAAYLDGNATAEQTRRVLKALAEDEALREIVGLSQLVDEELGMVPREYEELPLLAVAADCADHNRCGLLCEQFVLRNLEIQYDATEMERVTRDNSWLKPEGMPLYQIGRYAELQGLTVTRRFECKEEDIAEALEYGGYVLAAVDGGELTEDSVEEIGEEFYRVHIPDHVVVVVGWDSEREIVKVYNPNTDNEWDEYTYARFMNAWADSKNYLITINKNTMCEYNPNPIDVSDVELHESLNELREAIAENAHEIWGLERKKQGWTYGPKRDDDKKQNPCMVPYSELPEIEKGFDRAMAMNTLRLIKKLGYDIVKKQDTELYGILLERIRKADEEYRCPCCGHLVAKNDVFCGGCGEKLDVDWRLYE